LADRGDLLALLPMMEVRSFPTGRRGVSLTFTDYCEPIVKDRTAFHVLLEEAIAHGKKSGWRYIELRGGQEYLPDAPTSARYLGHKLALTSNEQDLLSCFRGNTRWHINKSAKEGLEIQIDTTLRSVEEFYRLHCMTRKRHGVPPQPFHFFRNIHEYILEKNLGYVVLASYNNTNIAGAVCFHFGNKALYKYSASDVKYRQLDASNLVLWEAIKKYSLSGYSEFCFGRTGCDDEGLRKFKAGWGTTENDIYYYRYDIGAGKFADNDPTKIANYAKYIERLPDPMLRVIGQVLYRHMG